LTEPVFSNFVHSVSAVSMTFDSTSGGLISIISGVFKVIFEVYHRPQGLSRNRALGLGEIQSQTGGYPDVEGFHFSGHGDAHSFLAGSR